MFEVRSCLLLPLRTKEQRMWVVCLSAAYTHIILQVIFVYFGIRYAIPTTSCALRWQCFNDCYNWQVVVWRSFAKTSHHILLTTINVKTMYSYYANISCANLLASRIFLPVFPFQVESMKLSYISLWIYCLHFPNANIEFVASKLTIIRWKFVG